MLPARVRRRPARYASQSRYRPYTCAVAIAILHAPQLARRIAPLTVGHASVDFSQGAVPVLLPYMHRSSGCRTLQDGIIFLVR